MADKTAKRLLLEQLASATGPLSIREIRERISGVKAVPDRTLRRWLSEAVERGALIRH
ncbi:MAG: hypothetical protein GWO24_21810, partial [Akkermansiaceae bacterium]|nr:hypothetical protein [Akkermansiaceae bacterium]